MENMNGTIAIWGVGKCMQDYYSKIASTEKISYFVDNMPEKWGRQYTEDRIECIRPDDLKQKGVDSVYIAIYDKQQYLNIKRQLDKYEITSQHIYEVYAELNHRQEIAFLEKTQYLKRSVYHRTESEHLVKFICYSLPTSICNFRCDYCYVKQLGGENALAAPDWRRKMSHSPQFMAYSLRRERMKGNCLISIAAGGETLLIDKIEELVYELLKDGHVVQISTNGVITDKIKKILSFPKELLENLFVVFSVHYLELVRNGKLDTFIDNVKCVRDSEASCYTTIVASDIYYPHIDAIKKTFMDRLGIYPLVDIMRDDSDLMNPKIITELPKEEYERVWKSFGSDKFVYRHGKGLTKVKSCLAGQNYFYIDGLSGDVRYCSAFRGEKNNLNNVYQNLDQDISIGPIGNCPAEWCFFSPAIAPLGILGEVKDVPTYGTIYQQVDNNGKKYIKEELLCLLERGIRGGSE